MTSAERVPRAFDSRPVPMARIVLVVVSTLIVHALVFQRLRVAEIGPDLLLTMTIVGGLQLGHSGGAALGFLAGLASDMSSADPVGVWALVGGLVGMTAGLLGERAYTASLRRPPVVLVVLLTVGALPLQRSIAYAIAEAPFPSVGRSLLLLVIVPLWGAVLTLPTHVIARAVFRGDR